MSIRIKNTRRNLTVGVIGQIITYVLSFVYRTVFIYYLGIEYLGINGLFSNVLTVISLAELGVGATITFNLYKPLAEKDYIRINMLMNYYGRIYKRVGIVIAILGIGISPFLNLIIKNPPDIEHLTFIYLLFLGNTVISYYNSYKRSIFNADQRRYLGDIYEKIFQVLRIVTQIIILVVTGNYLLTLIVQIIATFSMNFMISKKANKMYADVFNAEPVEMTVELKQDINKKIRAMFAHKVGSIVVFSTDSIVLSSFIGLYWVGLYSNYLLIINIIEKFGMLLSQSMIASIGNMIVTEDKKRAKEAFNQLSLLYFWIYSFAAVCLYQLLNPFITLWIGSQYHIDNKILLVIVFNFFLHGLRQNVLSFRNTLGLYWNDRYKSLVEAAINLMFSIYLVQEIGAIGVFIGTTISTLSTSLWIEPYILFKEFFQVKVRRYYFRLMGYGLSTFFIGLLIQVVSNNIAMKGWIGFIVSGIICVIISNSILFIIYGRTSEFKYLLSKAKGLR